MKMQSRKISGREAQKLLDQGLTIHVELSPAGMTLKAIPQNHPAHVALHRMYEEPDNGTQ